MIDKRLPKTNDAVNFLQSFSDVKRIMAVAEIVKMFNGEYTKEHNPFFDSTGQVNKDITELDIIKMGFYPKMLKWKRFMLDISRTNFKQMSDEICAWIKFDQEEEGEKIIKQLEEQILKCSTDLTYHNVLARVNSYNDELGKSKNKEALKLDVDIDGYVQVVEDILEELNERMEFIKERYKEQEMELAAIAPKRQGVPIDHQLRWNNAKKPFEEFVNKLIAKNLIITDSKRSPEEIMQILHTVFDVKDIPDLKTEDGDIQQFKPVERKKFYIPEKLKWNNTSTPKVFASKFGPLVEDHIVFIDKYDQAYERKYIAEILLQLFDIKKRGGGLVGINSLWEYLKQNRL